MSSLATSTMPILDLSGLCLRSDPWLSTTARIDCYQVIGVKGMPARLPPREFEKALYTAQVQVSDVKALTALTRRGFRMVDAAITLRSREFGCSITGRGDPGHVTVRHSTEADLPSVDAIAKNAFQKSRFHLDPLIPDTVANEIKRVWARNLVLGERGDGCLVASYNERVVGFIGYLSPADEPVVIDLIAVDHTVRGRGVGRTLVAEIQRFGNSLGHGVQVGTQLANRESVRMYEDLGFRFEKAVYTLHGHTDALEKA